MVVRTATLRAIDPYVRHGLAIAIGLVGLATLAVVLL